MELLEYRLRPKSNYLMLAPWQELYRLTEEWKKDLTFYEDELQFVQNLMVLYNYNIQLATNTTQLKERVNDALVQLKSIINQVDQHLAHIKKVIAEADNSEYLLFREEHNVLEDNINAFVQSFRQSKQKLFNVVEQRVKGPDNKSLTHH